jgi:hypothetical protein
VDYHFLCRSYLGEERAGVLDYRKIFRFARELNAHQLRATGQWFAEKAEGPTTEQFIDYLRSQRLSSNVDLGEVQAVDLHDLRGIDDVIRSLEANIIVPLENDALAAELNLKPKRGVLLAGPPGTGKTTIGRALAHRLKSKFFLLDGTFIAGTGDFYSQVHHLFPNGAWPAGWNDSRLSTTTTPRRSCTTARWYSDACSPRARLPSGTPGAAAGVGGVGGAEAADAPASAESIHPATSGRQIFPSIVMIPTASLFL